MTTTYEAAWVPDDNPNRPWDDAAELAADWLSDRAAAMGKRPLLVTFHLDSGRGIGPFGGWEHVSTRSPGSVTGSVGRPVLAYVPEGRVLALAHRYARSAALCVVETESFPLHGWAREVGAINLLNASRSDPLDAEVRKLLDRLVFAGNNGWADQPGKRDASRLLADLRGHVDLAEVLRHVLARGASERAVKKLGDIGRGVGLG